MGAPAARVGDITSHGTPLSPGPGAVTVLIEGRRHGAPESISTSARRAPAPVPTSAVL